MKIRIKGNSLRYRLTKSEVTELAASGLLEEKTEFVGSTLNYAVKAANSEHIFADFTNQTITLNLPNNDLQIWAATEQIGLESNMILADGSALYLLIEKDFKCIDADESEDQSDYFENPNLSC